MTSARHQAGNGVQRGLWVRQDAVAAGALFALGILLWAAGWYNAADQLALDEQVVPLNIAVAGTLVFGAGWVLWFLRGRRAITARRRALIARRRALLAPDADVPVGAVSLAPRSASPVLIAGAGLARFHRADCPLAAGRPEWAEASRSAHQRAGRSACGVCQP